eukprot:1125286-Pyramimonas_sp.AAC.1
MQCAHTTPEDQRTCQRQHQRSWRAMDRHALHAQPNRMRKHETHAGQRYTNADTNGRSSPAEHEVSYETQHEPRA